MGNLTMATVVIMAINCMLFIAQISIIAVNPQAGSVFDLRQSLQCQLDKNHCQGATYEIDQNIAQQNMPVANPSGSSGIIYFFTDIFNSLKSFFITAGIGLTYLLDIIASPITFLQYIFPTPDLAPVAFAIGALWYGVTFFLIINFIRGGDA